MFKNPTTLLLLSESITAEVMQHYSRSYAALLPKLCSITAEVVQHCCLTSAALLHKLCQHAAHFLALSFCYQ
jgi:uncharacterized membrane-anchored protein YhcB (DUF1043 family)